MTRAKQTKTNAQPTTAAVIGRARDELREQRARLSVRLVALEGEAETVRAEIARFDASIATLEDLLEEHGVPASAAFPPPVEPPARPRKARAPSPHATHSKAVLAHLRTHPDRWFLPREVAEEVGTPLNSAAKILLRWLQRGKCARRATDQGANAARWAYRAVGEESPAASPPPPAAAPRSIRAGSLADRALAWLREHPDTWVRPAELGATLDVPDRQSFARALRNLEARGLIRSRRPNPRRTEYRAAPADGPDGEEDDPGG